MRNSASGLPGSSHISKLTKCIWAVIKCNPVDPTHPVFYNLSDVCISMNLSLSILGPQEDLFQRGRGGGEDLAIAIFPSC